MCLWVSLSESRAKSLVSLPSRAACAGGLRVSSREGHSSIRDLALSMTAHLAQTVRLQFRHKQGKGHIWPWALVAKPALGSTSRPRAAYLSEQNKLISSPEVLAQRGQVDAVICPHTAG